MSVGVNVGTDGGRGVSSPDAADVMCRTWQNNRSKKKGKFHGKGGLMQVENARYMNPLTKMFFKACEQAGMPENKDFNDWSHPQEGFGRFQVCTGGIILSRLPWVHGRPTAHRVTMTTFLDG